MPTPLNLAHARAVRSDTISVSLPPRFLAWGLPTIAVATSVLVVSRISGWLLLTVVAAFSSLLVSAAALPCVASSLLEAGVLVRSEYYSRRELGSLPLVLSRREHSSLARFDELVVLLFHANMAWTSRHGSGPLDSRRRLFRSIRIDPLRMLGNSVGPLVSRRRLLARRLSPPVVAVRRLLRRRVSPPSVAVRRLLGPIYVGHMWGLDVMRL